MYYKQYKPTCVELLFGKLPERFMAQCAFPKHDNARLRTNPAFESRPYGEPAAFPGQFCEPACRLEQCRYCPNKQHPQDYKNAGNILRIDNFSSSGSPHNFDFEEDRYHRRDVWKRRGEPKTKKDKFKEWYVNKRVQEMKANRRIRSYSDDLLSNCCEYCCQSNAGEKTERQKPKRCCVCGETDHEFQEKQKMSNRRTPHGRKASLKLHNSNSSFEPRNYERSKRPPKAYPSRHFRNMNQPQKTAKQKDSRPRHRQRELDITKHYDKNYSDSLRSEPNNIKPPFRRDKEQTSLKKSKKLMNRPEKTTQSSSNESLEQLKEESLKEFENCPQNPIYCECEYSMKNVPDQVKCLYDPNEISCLRKKLDQALSEIQRCRTEIEKNRTQTVNCNYDPEYSASILSDCQQKCANLGRLVERLEQNLEKIENKSKNLTLPDPKEIRTSYVSNREVSPKPPSAIERSAQKQEYTQRKPEDPVQKPFPARYHPSPCRPKPGVISPKLPFAQRPKSAETIGKSIKSFPKPIEKRSKEKAAETETRRIVLKRSSSSPKASTAAKTKGPIYHVKPDTECCKPPGGPCYHIKCFPPDQVYKNPRFKKCPQYNQIVEDLKRKYKYKPA